MMKLFLFSALCLICLMACKKETGVAGPAGPSGPNGSSSSDTAAITGNLALYDEFCSPVPDSSGVIVTLTGGKSVLYDTTDSHGHYSFAAQSSGTYNLSFEKPDFGTMRLFGYSHATGGGTIVSVSDVAMAQFVDKTRVDSIVASTPVLSIYAFELYLDTPSTKYLQYYGNLAILIGKDPSVNISNYSVLVSEYAEANATTGGYTADLGASTLSQYFNLGDTMYITGCTFNRYVHKYKDPHFLFDLSTSYFYTDPNSGKDIYPNISYAPKLLKVIFNN